MIQNRGEAEEIPRVMRPAADRMRCAPGPEQGWSRLEREDKRLPGEGLRRKEKAAQMGMTDNLKCLPRGEEFYSSVAVERIPTDTTANKVNRKRATISPHIHTEYYWGIFWQSER